MDGGVMSEWEQVGDRERELTPKGAGGVGAGPDGPPSPPGDQGPA